MSINISGRRQIRKPNFAKRSSRKRVLDVNVISPYLISGWEEKLEINPQMMYNEEVLNLVKVNLKQPIVNLIQIEHLKYFLGDYLSEYLQNVSDAMSLEREKRDLRLKEIYEKRKLSTKK